MIHLKRTLDKYAIAFPTFLITGITNLNDLKGRYLFSTLNTAHTILIQMDSTAIPTIKFTIIVIIVCNIIF
ncbi:hypothetical protein [Tenacibaculum sp. 190524A02b]|uniref:hypothetical protein n=1 Tax=Tenacibaculum vairaonense TaxID=3137860 RepID=UPI0032B2331F